MKDQQWLAIIVGLLGLYLLAHAAVAGYGLYLANEALRPPVPIDGPYLPELRKNYPTLVALFIAATSLSALSLTACAGFFRNSKWAVHLWLTTSGALVVCVGIAVGLFGVAWTHYLFELVAVCGSCWYAQQAWKESHEG